MTNVKYHSLFARSLATLFENPVLFVPNAFMVFFSLFLIVMFTVSNGLFMVLWDSPEVITSQQGLSDAIHTVREQSPQWFMFTLILYIILVFLIDIFFITAKYGMIRDILLRDRTNLNQGLQYAIRHFWKSVGTHSINYLLIVSPLFFLAGLAFSIGTISGFFQNAGYLMGFIIFLLIAFIYWIEIFFRLLFLYPVMVFEGTTSWQSFRQDFHYVKNHLGHTLISWMIFITLWILFFTFRNPVGNVLRSTTSIWIVVLLTIVTLVAEAVLSTFEHTFIILKAKPKY